MSTGDEKTSINVKRALAALKAKQTTKSPVENLNAEKQVSPSRVILRSALSIIGSITGNIGRSRVGGVRNES